MPLLSLHREATQYVSDNATTYQITAQSAVAFQTALGGVVAAGTEPTYPFGYRTRRAVFRTQGLTPNVSREVEVYTPAAYAAIARGTTINLNHLGNSTAFVATGEKTAEKIRVRRVTLQIT